MKSIVSPLPYESKKDPYATRGQRWVDVGLMLMTAVVLYFGFGLRAPAKSSGMEKAQDRQPQAETAGQPNQSETLASSKLASE